MKVVLVKSPKLVGGILRMVFGIKKSTWINKEKPWEIKIFQGFLFIIPYYKTHS